MRVLIAGAGAIGSVLGGFLAGGGHDVTLFGRAWHLDLVRRQGLRISGVWGEHHVRRLTVALASAELLRQGPFDWVVVCVKSHQVAGILDIVTMVMSEATLVCAMQNGLGHYELLTQRIPSDRVALGRVIFGVELEPGHARVTVCADDVLIGAIDERFPRERIIELAQALRASGVPARATSSIRIVLWAKLLYNCALNGLSTLFEVPYGGLLEREATRRLMGEIIEEAYRIAAAHHVPLDPPTADAYREALFTRLIPATGGHRSSMLQDVLKGKPSEIEAMNGALARLARQAGIRAPVNELVTRLIHAKERFMGCPS